MTGPHSILDNCVIIGASHAGVQVAFSLRREGWVGNITLIDKDPRLPYHRPPLSKEFLSSTESIEKHKLRPWLGYENANIDLKLGKSVARIDREQQNVVLEDGDIVPYRKLVLATGARPLMPKIEGIKDINNLFYLRSAEDAESVKAAYANSKDKRVLIVGGGYIGLEAAASLRELGASVCVLERESKVLARIGSIELSSYYQKLHESNGVEIHVNKHVISFGSTAGLIQILCDDSTQYQSDIVIIGVGINVNQELAEESELAVNDGIQVDQHARTSDPHIYAVGDCTQHYNPHYQRHVRLESVQNAVDQAKVAAASICGNESPYDTIPWFWSDQYDTKLQMVGLVDGHDSMLLRPELDKPDSFSIWYFSGDRLLAVHAVNSPKAYMLGTKCIKESTVVNKQHLKNPSMDLKSLVANQE